MILAEDLNLFFKNFPQYACRLIELRALAGTPKGNGLKPRVVSHRLECVGMVGAEFALAQFECPFEMRFSRSVVHPFLKAAPERATNEGLLQGLALKPLRDQGRSAVNRVD